MSTHVMLDLETLGKGNDAHILSIGAVKFDATGILDRFHVGVELDSCSEAGSKIDASTVGWWLDLTSAEPEAWRAWRALDKVPLWNALDGFNQWYHSPVGDIPLEPVQASDMPIWGNGATFDNVILRSAYAACGLEYPAQFWLDRCYRTLKSLTPEVQIERKGTHHSAVDDAESQALHMIRIYKHLGLEL